VKFESHCIGFFVVETRFVWFSGEKLRLDGALEFVFTDVVKKFKMLLDFEVNATSMSVEAAEIYS
jgi:hypothetical protein